MTADSPKILHVPTADGAVLHATVTGNGPPLLLVSGLGGTAAFWASNAAAFAESFRVIRFDQRGIGSSTRGNATCDIDLLARDCLVVLDAVGADKAILLGHSTGGCIGQSLARQAPTPARRTGPERDLAASEQLYVGVVHNAPGDSSE